MSIVNSKPNLRLVLNLEVDYVVPESANREVLTKELKSNLEAIARSAYAEGDVTGGTEAEVEGYRPSIKEEVVGSSTASTFTVLVIEHSRGVDVNLFDDEEKAFTALDEYVQLWWDQEMPGDEMPDERDARIEQYFEDISEWYRIETLQPQ